MKETEANLETAIAKPEKPAAYMTEATISVVARDMALGATLEDISLLRNLPLPTIQKIARGRLFKKRMEDLQREIDQQMIAEVAEDPVQAKLRGLTLRAVERLGEEMDNYDCEEGKATAGTRIKAANSLLDRAGVVGKRDDMGGTVVLQLSTEKLDGIQASLEAMKRKTFEDIPDSVDGMD